MCLKRVGIKASPGAIIIGVRRVPTTVRIKWPAQILAVSRNARVRGRIRVLRDSTKTRKGARKLGAPLGISPARTLEGEKEMPAARRLAQRGRARGRVTVRWAEEVNVYGRRPEILRVIIIIKRDVRKSGRPVIVLVDENLAEEMMGSIKEKVKAFWCVTEVHRLGCMSASAAKGRLQNNGADRCVRGLIAGSKEVNRSGVMLGSTGY